MKDKYTHGKGGFASKKVEIKLGGENLINEGVKTLLSLTKKIDTERMREPSFRMILTAVGEFAYQRADGIWVVPVAALKN